MYLNSFHRYILLLSVYFIPILSRYLGESRFHEQTLDDHDNIVNWMIRYENIDFYAILIIHFFFSNIQKAEY